MNSREKLTLEEEVRLENEVILCWLTLRVLDVMEQVERENYKTARRKGKALVVEILGRVKPFFQPSREAA